jgi:hypothetical protein
MIAKLPSLAHMAVSAGVQKRNYLRRRHPDLSRAFLLERARLVIEPWDLEDVVGAIAGAGVNESKLALDAGRRVLQTLRNAAVQAGQSAGLDVVVELTFQKIGLESDDPATYWRAACGLSEVADSTLASVSLRHVSTDGIWRQLRHAWRTSGISQVCFKPCS